jgi:DNA-binding transcriptional ArsR family regulator
LALAGIDVSSVGDWSFAGVSGTITTDGEDHDGDGTLFQAIGRFDVRGSFPGTSHPSLGGAPDEGREGGWRMEGEASFVALDGQTVAGARPAPSTSSMAAVGAAAGLAVLAALVYAFGSRILGGLVGLFTRKTPKELLRHVRRAEIVAFVKANPGLSINRIGRKLGMHRTTVDFHVRRLEAADLLERRRVPFHEGVFRAGVEALDATPSTTMRRKHAVAVVEAVRRRPGLIQKELLEAVGLSRKVFRDLEPALLREGLLRRRADGRAVRYYANAVQ